MRFEHPEAAWLLLLIILAIFVLGLAARRSAAIRRHWLGLKAGKVNLTGLTIRALSLFLLTVAATGPEAEMLTTAADVQERQVIFALDISASMNVSDVSPTRLEAAKQMIRTVVEQLKGEQFGLVVFSDYAYVQSPLTSDIEAFTKLLNIANTGQFANTGTDVRSGLLAVASSFESLPVGKVSRAAVLLTDGEDFGENYQSALTRLRRQGATVFVAGVGTPGGGFVPAPADSTGRQRPTSAFSKLNTSSLEALAQEEGTGFVLANSPTQAGWEVAEWVKKLPPSGTHGNATATEWVPIYQWPLCIGVLLLALSLFLLPGMDAKYTGFLLSPRSRPS